MILQDKVSSIKGVGDKRAKLLKNLKIDTIDDLLHLFPRKYEDRREVITIMEAQPGKDVLDMAELFQRGWAAIRIIKKLLSKSLYRMSLQIWR